MVVYKLFLAEDEMRTFAGFLLLLAGVVLLAWGIQSSDSIRTEISRVVESVPSDRAVWVAAGGAILGLVGLGMISTGRRHSH
jgi:hypothetical protein